MENLPESVCEMDRLSLSEMEEVLKKVFEVLPRKDRKAGVMVNSLWRQVGEASAFWAWVQLPVVEDQDSRARVIDMLRCERLAGVEVIQIEAGAVSEELLQTMINHEGLKRIELNGAGGELPAGLNPQRVVEALTGMEILFLGFDSLPTHLLIPLLTKVSEGGSNLKKLSLPYSNLADVPAALVASALTRMVRVYLYNTMLTSAQVAALLEAIDQGDSSIEKLWLIDSLPTEGSRTGPLNLKPLVKVEEVRLPYNFHTQQDLVDFFAAMSESMKLRKLEIRGLPWPAEEVMDGSTEVMARAINFLEEVDIRVFPYQVCRLQSSPPEVLTWLNLENIVLSPAVTDTQTVTFLFFVEGKRPFIQKLIPPNQTCYPESITKLSFRSMPSSAGASS